MEKAEEHNEERDPLNGRPTDACYEDLRLRCGWLGFRPNFLQRFNNARSLLVCLCLASTLQGMIQLGFVNVCLTTLEKRYDLKSRYTGVIVSALDVSVVLLCLPSTYLASRPGASKPRWLGGGMLMVGLGSLVFTLPHFLSPPYDVNGRGSDGLNGSSIMCTDAILDESGSDVGSLIATWHFDLRLLFILGQVMHGIGFTPLMSFGIAFLDESVPREVSSLYIGIYAAMMAGGVAMGFAIGSSLLSLYVDWPYVDPQKFELTPSSDLWLGCWWLCFLVSAVLAGIAGILLLTFPLKETHSPLKRLGSYAQVFHEQQTPASANVVGPRETDVRPVPPEFRKVFGNKTFMLLAVSGVGSSFLSSGLGAFTPKLFENQFSLSASSAAFIVGAVSVPSSCLGCLTGGWLLKKFKVDCSGNLKICTFGLLFLALTSFSFLLYCPNQDFAGVQIQYQNSSHAPSLPNLTAACNLDCGCEGVAYNPVCGANNVIYYSPCHAGCSRIIDISDEKIYSNCSCVPLLDPVSTWGDSEPYHEDPSFMCVTPAPLLTGGVAVTDKCPSQCHMLPVFIVVLVTNVFITFVVVISALTAGLRCIDESHRSLGFGVRAQISRTFGFFPGPILFGLLIDRTCLLWDQASDGRQGACAVYENMHMNRTMMYLCLVCLLFTSLLCAVAWWCYNSSDDGSRRISSVEQDQQVPSTAEAGEGLTERPGSSLDESTERDEPEELGRIQPHR